MRVVCYYFILCVGSEVNKVVEQERIFLIIYSKYYLFYKYQISTLTENICRKQIKNYLKTIQNDLKRSKTIKKNDPKQLTRLCLGNDLARVLRWGPGYGGDEDPQSLLRDVIEAEEIRLDRWTVVFR